MMNTTQVRKLAGFSAQAELNWFRQVYQVVIYQDFSDGTQSYVRVEKEYPAELDFVARAHAAALSRKGDV